MNIRTLVLAATFMPAIALAQEATTAQDTTYTQQSATVSNTYDTTFVFGDEEGEGDRVSRRTGGGAGVYHVALYPQKDIQASQSGV